MIDCSFREHLPPAGRAVVLITNSLLSSLARCTFDENHGGTAALELSGSNQWPRVEHCTFAGNTHLGSSLLSSSNMLTVYRSVFEGNQATSTTSPASGGAMALLGGSAQIDECEFERNSAIGAGALAAFLTNCQVLNSSFRTNTSQTNGGAIRAIAAPLTLDGVTLESNTALGLGGGVSATNQSLTARRCAIVGNSSGVSGGGVHAAAALTLFETEITCNSAPVGGGLDLLTPPTSIRGDPLAGRFNVIRGNVAASGSAIYCRIPSSSGPVDASYVCWGVADPNFDPHMLWDALDDPLVALVVSGQVANCRPADCQCAPSTYCASSPNSTGAAATIGYSGSASDAANDLTLTVDGCPPDVLGGFYFGPWRSAMPLGAGTRCIDGGRVRLGAVTTDSGGHAEFSIDLLAAPAVGRLTVGSTWNFQFWYRDAAFASDGMNLSNALAVTFCP